MRSIRLTIEAIALRPTGGNTRGFRLLSRCGERSVGFGLTLAAFTPAAAASESLVGPSLVTPPVIVLGLLLLATVGLLFRFWQTLTRVVRQHERDTRILIDRSNELEATLSSMIEGVLAVDLRQQVLTVNDAAAMLLHVHGARSVGKHIDEVIESAALRRFISRTLESDKPIQENVDLVGGLASAGRPAEPRSFQAQGAILRDREGRRIGSLIVLHDVTRVRRLEVVRRDFVANASHEIKTPVAAIKAAAETLRDAFDDDREAARRFIAVIARQADRLHALVEDLLTLARIEHDAEHQRLSREPRRIAELLGSAIDHCRPLAESHNVQLTVRCPPDLVVSINSPMLEQAIVNLIDNAVKYGGEGKTVRIEAGRNNGFLAIHVVDQGPGIEPAHLSRVFERFYRTDKARSRQLGGTGLGLAIVRHVAIAHGGRASAVSQLGHGATFTIEVPAA